MIAIFEKLKSLIPKGWFNSSASVRDAVFGGVADTLDTNRALLDAVRAQTRIATASGWFLDLIAWDFFGPNFLRNTNETDASWRTRLVAEIFRQRVTRHGIFLALQNLTGRTPAVFEPTNPLDTGGYGCAMGYGVAGAYGSMLMPNEVVVTAFRPASSGIPNVDGYDGTIGGYGSGSLKYGTVGEITGGIPDAAITNAVTSTVAAGVNPIVYISN